MIVDENDFFRQATIRICSSLEIETVMHRFLGYLSRFIPVDMMFIHLYEPSLGAMRTLAWATAAGGKALDRITALSVEVRADLEDQTGPDVYIVKRPDTDPLCLLLGHPKDTESSVLVMRLRVDGRKLGSLTLLVGGLDRYGEEHIHLLSLLNEPFVIALSNTLRHQEVLKLKARLSDDNRYLHEELLRLSGDEIVGQSFGLKGVMDMVRQVAPSNSPVLILGETGVGKEMIANTIHHLSPRRDGPLIKVNCGAIPETLLDTELFGHERGAFTGAVSQSRGRFERAHQGTIFLDEVGELPPQAQVRLLRVLQHKEIERVGGSKPLSVDIRLIAATHRHLEEMVRTRRFREDLWFRLNVFPITIPPLRERKGDIPALVHHFIDRKSRELRPSYTPTLARGAIDRLMAYDWPGNIRELENVVERALILNRGQPITFDDLPRTARNHESSAVSLPPREALKLDEVISDHIRRVLELTKGRVHGPNGAAEILEVNPSTLRNRMNRLSISYGRRKK